jgi:ribosomal protein L37AE/L43A
VQPFIEFAAFNGEGSVDHDDDIDAITQALNWLRTRHCGVSDWMQKQIDKLAKTADRKLCVEFCPACRKKTVERDSEQWACSSCKAHGLARGSRLRTFKQGM